MKSYNFSKNKVCVDCGKVICNVSARCRSCASRSQNNLPIPPSGNKSPLWKGGRVEDGRGYILIRDKENGYGSGYKLEHRAIMEKHLGRKLSTKEVVHHKNRNRQDNRLENLLLVTNITHKSGDMSYFEYECPYCRNKVGIKH